MFKVEPPMSSLVSQTASFIEIFQGAFSALCACYRPRLCSRISVIMLIVVPAWIEKRFTDTRGGCDLYELILVNSTTHANRNITPFYFSRSTHCWGGGTFLMALDRPRNRNAFSDDT
jgi:hypothetical protein